MNQSSISDYSSFRDAVYEAATDDNKFNDFLYHPEILQIFGHYKYENALKIWEKMTKEIISSKYFSMTMERLGSVAGTCLLPRHSRYNEFHLDANIKFTTPNRNQVTVCGKNGRVTYLLQSFCLEFIRVALDIKDKLGIDSYEGHQIVELGVGFLGQYFTFANEFDKYYMIDLPEVLLLADKITKEKSIQYNKYKGSDFWMPNMIHKTEKISAFDTGRYPFIEKGLLKNGIFFSSHAFSELTAETQMSTYDNVIKYCRRGYILMNDIGHYHGVKTMKQEEHVNKLEELNKGNITISEEWPLTHRGNYVLTWR